MEPVLTTHVARLHSPTGLRNRRPLGGHLFVTAVVTDLQQLFSLALGNESDLAKPRETRGDATPSPRTPGRDEEGHQQQRHTQPDHDTNRVSPPRPAGFTRPPVEHARHDPTDQHTSATKRNLEQSVFVRSLRRVHIHSPRLPTAEDVRTGDGAFREGLSRSDFIRAASRLATWSRRDHRNVENTRFEGVVGRPGSARCVPPCLAQSGSTLRRDLSHLSAERLEFAADAELP